MREAKILVADDNVEIIEFLERYLELFDFTVIPAIGGKRALEILQNDRGIDLLLADIQMPDIDGIELVRWTCKHSPATACICMSGGATAEHEKKISELGVNHLVRKPFHYLSELVALIVAEITRQRNESFVLVADDDRDFGRYARNILSKEGIGAVEVSHARTVDAVLRSSRPSLVFFDGADNLGRMLELCRTHAGDISFVSISSAPESEQSPRLDAGAVCALRKPVPSDLLMDVAMRYSNWG